jgi:hypothetical protein
MVSEDSLKLLYETVLRATTAKVKTVTIAKTILLLTLIVMGSLLCKRMLNTDPSFIRAGAFSLSFGFSMRPRCAPGYKKSAIGKTALDSGRRL